VEAGIAEGKADHPPAGGEVHQLETSHHRSYTLLTLIAHGRASPATTKLFTAPLAGDITRA